MSYVGGITIKTVFSIIGKLLLCSALVIGLLLLVVLVYGASALMTGQSLADMASPESGPWLYYAQIIIFIASPLLMYVWFERKQGWPLGIRQTKAHVQAAKGMLAGIVLITVSAVLIGSFGAIEWTPAAFTPEVLRSLLSGIALFACVAISEELFARGYLQGLLRHHYGASISIIISSILFSLMHSLNPGMFDSPYPFINITLAGVMLAVARETTGGLWMPIGIHLTWNLFQGHVYGFNVSGSEPVPSILKAADRGPSFLSGGSFGLEGSVVTVFVLLTGIAAIYVLTKKRASQAPRV